VYEVDLLNVFFILFGIVLLIFIDFSKFAERPLGTVCCSQRRHENNCLETDARPWSRLGKRKSKICSFLVGIGLVLVIMGCIVLVEKSRISSVYDQNSDHHYLQITATVLLVLGIFFISFSVSLLLCYFFKSYKKSSGSAIEDANNGRVLSDISGYVITQNSSPFSTLQMQQQHICSVYTISENLGDPPKYCDLTIEDYPPPPKYYEPNNVCSSETPEKQLENLEENS